MGTVSENLYDSDKLSRLGRPRDGGGVVNFTQYGNFDIICNDFSRIFSPELAPHVRFAIWALLSDLINRHTYT